MGEITQEDFAAMDDLFENFIPMHKSVWLFGNGDFGTAFYRYLQECGVTASGFVVSNPKTSRTEDGISVLSIKDFRQLYENERSIGLILTVDEKYYDEILPNLMFLGDDLRFLKRKYKQLAFERCGDTKKFRLLSFHIADKCNLACYGCTAASPIAKKSIIYSYETFSCDIQKLSDLFGNNIENIYFTGGDVFQNPHFLEFIKLSRNLFPDSKISFSTNGLAFHKQEDSFWRILGENKVLVYWTLYSVIYKKYEETIEIAKKYNVNLLVIGDAANEDKTSWRIPFAMRKNQKVHDFLFCSFHRKCAVIANGYYLPCCAPRMVKHIKNYFEIDIPLTEAVCVGGGGDFMDLRNVNKACEIENWLKKRPPLCDYCAIRQRYSMGKWLPSGCKKEEWILE